MLGVQGVRDDPTYSTEDTVESAQQEPQAMTASSMGSISAGNGARTEILAQGVETVGMQHVTVHSAQQESSPPAHIPEYAVLPRSKTPTSQMQPKNTFALPPPEQFRAHEDLAPANQPSTPPHMTSPSFHNFNERVPTPPQQMMTQEAYPPPTPPQPLDISPSRLPSSIVPQVEQVDPGILNISKKEFKELFGQSPPASGECQSIRSSGNDGA